MKPCPTCAHTSHPGLYLGFNALIEHAEVCPTCNGTRFELPKKTVLDFGATYPGWRNPCKEVMLGGYTRFNDTIELPPLRSVTAGHKSRASIQAMHAAQEDGRVLRLANTVHDSVVHKKRCWEQLTSHVVDYMPVIQPDIINRKEAEEFVDNVLTRHPHMAAFINGYRLEKHRAKKPDHWIVTPPSTGLMWDAADDED